ncbi:helix-turn-helix domain-containing protein [Luteolibacter soli]|uniref:Helix-turn-helix domain-containing protein n=1 Tax=Luteolibacter soli TaxID=3135280 RepID=A0ABU9AX19_9BACT
MSASLSALITFEDRPSDSPFIERVWRSRSDQAGVFRSIASCYWDLVFAKVEGKTMIVVHGPETVASMADLPPDGDWFGLRFKVGTFIPQFRSSEFRDRNDIILPNATSRSFWLNGSVWEIPTFENAETFVNRLVRRGVIQEDRVAKAAIHGEPQDVTTRTEQRRVVQITGLTCGTIHQIERARQATLRLRQGASILDVVHEAGYYDQAHLTRSLQRFIGLSPAKIMREQEQLSLLYNREQA